MALNVKKSQYDLCAIGSALLDFIYNVDNSFLDKLKLKKGEMHLIDEERSREIFAIMNGIRSDIAPGGSSANTAAGVAKLGGKAAFIGAVANDDYGTVYINKTRESGVQSFISREQGLTGHAITFITPDSERTFATHLGAALNLSVENVDFSVIASSSFLHLEGYLFESPSLREICYRAMETAHNSGTLVSVDLADPALIKRIGNIFDDVIKNHADILFMNEEEAFSLTGARDESAFSKLPERSSVVVIKLGENGSLIKQRDLIIKIPSFKTDVVNTNGAGDMYAAGFLYGISSGKSLEIAGKIASLSAAAVVASPGARAEKDIDLSVVL